MLGASARNSHRDLVFCLIPDEIVLCFAETKDLPYKSFLIFVYIKTRIEEDYKV
jgi:hypothetical protein